jgi:hypothetical protein
MYLAERVAKFSFISFDEPSRINLIRSVPKYSHGMIISESDYSRRVGWYVNCVMRLRRHR